MAYEDILKNDDKATIVQAEKLVKIRKLDRTVCDNLKELYDFRCQVTGEKIGDEFGCNVVEAHHIDFFTQSMNNNFSNVIILSPNFHRIIHRTEPLLTERDFVSDSLTGLLRS